ncbi:MAG: hypothetical protein BTN85_0818 [Candidatus Methanohalarchaeum thermophilum]|uniref:Uncharacterized protein n=1 Tax=Methanohalarchaeum thermophilum TaxID=1903181 RepID=A0A1Q6DVD0_METT1|nr:MAG: hypothetical protein BTN85_0818 [Candidatus Methanohalarchaeum thermophilum]
MTKIQNYSKRRIQPFSNKQRKQKINLNKQLDGPMYRGDEK